ncbi:hypothetical protein GGS23DRAFT_610352 [Durotheca rogersii]|uniref:uncharacterized protein n=1 Tax=Durotheca rogersii TaxID=419775 RepID=UPI00222086DB|nr:uncharacterized protein GGS23DRAFT_610352 [Durotheca rogersii]KAI5862638.1 hypothetical protein GGS23DRAFT_610352 [Durotheca rogersii]
MAAKTAGAAEVRPASEGTVDGLASYVGEFAATPGPLSKPLADLLATYSGIPRDAQAAHIVRVRDEAYARFPYPCLGTFRFLDLDLAAHFGYAEHVLAPLLAPRAVGAEEEEEEGEGPLFLDLGTCFGQDLRRLAHDGVAAARLWASDIEPELVELGFRLFGDAGRLGRGRFLCPGDLLAAADDAGDRLRELDGRVTILHATAVFHLFSLDEQRRAADRCLRLLRRDPARPALVIGAQVGSLTPGPFSRRNLSGNYIHKYRHDARTWRDLWRDAAAAPPWRDLVARVDVESRLLRRVHGQDADGDAVTTFVDADADTPIVWQMFEVWVTFAEQPK